MMSAVGHLTLVSLGCTAISLASFFSPPPSPPARGPHFQRHGISHDDWDCVAMETDEAALVSLVLDFFGKLEQV